jgi:hypothetical protein
MNESSPSVDQLSTSFPIETLEEIIRNCQRNERRLHELERHARHERKKAERILREAYRERDKQISKPQRFFISLDDDKQKIDRNTSSIDNTHRVRFDITEKDKPRKKSSTKDDELDDLARRVEKLLSSLNTQRLEASMLEHDDNQPPLNQSVSLQESLELLRPEFISQSQQRAQRIHHLREERQYKSEVDPERSHSSSITPRPATMTYKEMKQASKKKYEQLPEYHDRLQQGLISEIRRRNYLRAKLFRIRLRQHVLLHGRTNIDASLKMIDI